MPPLNYGSIAKDVFTLSKEPDIKVEFVKHIQPLFSQYCVAEIESTFNNGMNLRQIPTLPKANLSIKKCSFRFFEAQKFTNVEGEQISVSQCYRMYKEIPFKKCSAV